MSARRTISSTRRAFSRPAATWSAISRMTASDGMTGSSVAQPIVNMPISSSSRCSPTRTSDRTPPSSSARRTAGASGRCSTGPLMTCPTGAIARTGGRVTPQDLARPRPGTLVASAVAGQDRGCVAVGDDDRAAERRPSTSTRTSRGCPASAVRLAVRRSPADGQRDDRRQLALDADRGRHVALDADDAERRAVGGVDPRRGRPR